MYHSVSNYSRHSENLFYSLGTLLDVSLINNARVSITGVLAFADRQFAQILEGPEAAIDALYAQICGDGRHRNIQLDIREACPHRLFPLWSMAFVGFEANLLPMFNTLAGRAASATELAGVMQDLAALVDTPALAESFA